MKLKDSTHQFKRDQEKERLVSRCPKDCSREQIAQCGQYGRHPEYCAVIRKKVEEFVLTFI